MKTLCTRTIILIILSYNVILSSCNNSGNTSTASEFITTEIEEINIEPSTDNSLENLNSNTPQTTPNIQDSIWVFESLAEDPYPFKTELVGGTHLEHKVYRAIADSSFVQSITLMRGDKKIRNFGDFSFGLPYKNIGYVGADFEHSFVMTYSYGSRNPHYIDLVDKATGNTLKRGTWVDADETEEVLLYIEDEHEKTEKLILYDVKNQREIEVKEFQSSRCVTEENGGLHDCIRIDTISEGSIWLKVDYKEEKIVHSYKRILKK